MKSERKYRGFSLTEVLLAVGTLAIGMIFIAGVFPVAIHFTTIATERTIAAVVADEAFAKIRLYGVDFNSPLWQVNPTVDFNDVSFVNQSEFAYPSTGTLTGKHYYWSALCRRVDVSNVQVTVFISRKVGSGTIYHGGTGDRPIPMPVAVSALGDNMLLITEAGEEKFINDGYTIVGNETGWFYRVLERKAEQLDTIVLDLDRVWGPDNSPPSKVWVVPPPIGGGRYPCIAIYQKVIRF